DLPPYDVLDPIVRALVVENRSWDELTRSFDEGIARDVARRLRASEHKRRQIPLVLKVSPKAFGMGRRFPITHRFAG
ncbi:MAG: NAD+ synthase, partial [Candidatus Bipolaricaulis anaerobius]|nr:NAD+ synthase [Candidatus Bipolaricaulis anaerobius]